MTVLEVLEQAKALNTQQRKQLVKLLIDTLDAPEIKPQRQRHMTELRGLGRNIWAGIDAQEYVNQLHDEWDQRP